MQDPADMTVNATPRPEDTHDGSARFRILTAGFCALAAALSLLVMLIAASNWPSDEPSRLALLGVPLGAVVLLALAWGLVSETSWSLPLGVLWLYALVVIGVIEFVVAFFHGGITVPLGATAALLILTQRPGGHPHQALGEGDRRVAATLIGAYVVATLWPYAVGYLATPGASLVT
jgi:hypothetical protein